MSEPDARSMLERMDYENIFTIETDESGKTLIGEACDRWFTVEMSKADLKQLAAEIVAYAEAMP